MHYRCEIVMPPTDDVRGAIASILRPFSEERPDDATDDDWSPGYGFWDFWVLGGRWAGQKMVEQYGKERVDEFWAWCAEAGIKVSGFVAGKQTIATPEMREQVDAKWSEMFSPAGTMVRCPLFDHANDQLGLRGESALPGDVMLYAEVPDTLTCSRIIFAGPSYDHDSTNKAMPWTGPLKATFMLTDAEWNGVNHMPVRWDGTLGDARRQFEEHFRGYKDEYRRAVTPTGLWLVATVDYHS